MTLQRIDEDTYIDDTLVTCVEYQLFIDEMREQGKYYQPDHWTSYQFSKGQAKTPILGIRPTDAREFCKWLSDHERSGWLFRLPKTEEKNIFGLSNHNLDKFAYWINGKRGYAWVTSAQINPRMLTISNVNSLCRSLDIGDIAKELEMEINHALQQTTCLDVSKSLSFVKNIVKRGEISIDKEIKRFLNRKNIRYGNVFPDILERAFSVTFDLRDDVVFQSALDMCLDIITLQNRRIGRSPAFEGIRLVKERIR